MLVGDGGAQVAFQTATATVTFENSKGLPLAGGAVWVVAPDGTWTQIGTTDTTGLCPLNCPPGRRMSS